MDLINYIGLRVKVVLLNDYYYVGKVTNADETSIDILDFKGNKVSLNKSSISTIQEVAQ